MAHTQQVLMEYEKILAWNKQVKQICLETCILLIVQAYLYHEQL